MEPRYEKILTQYQELSEKLGKATAPDDLKTLGKKQTELQPVVEKINAWKKIEQEIKENEELVKSDDSSISELANEEIKKLKTESENLIVAIEDDLLPKDPLDDKNVIMEIRAAAGGDESSLFCGELFRMYGRYAEGKSWKTRLISESRNEVGGFKEVIFEISGDKVYADLKFESGVHRVQRVPETEKSGRVHTSTVTVAVLPQVGDDDFKIDPKDLKVETSTSRGAGGQSVNTTYSAIKITHIPTGITAQSQDERSQVQNKEKAMKVILARVFAYYEEKRKKELTDQRRSQIGSGDRSEKIRTYNFPQDRITDHRINESFKQIGVILDGKLEVIINKLKEVEKNLAKSQ